MYSEVDRIKKMAADYAVDNYVKSGMVIGLGAGTTAAFALRRMAEHLQIGTLTNIVGVPCARSVEEDAYRMNIPLTNLDDHPVIDLTLDGADEVDPDLNVIKGGGGALLREKIVAQASQQEIIMVDDAKLSPSLGTRWAVPIEVTPFGLGSQIGFLQSLGGDPVLRIAERSKPFQTDQGNYILDTRFEKIRKLTELAAQLNGRAGIVEHGLFLGLVSAVVVASRDGVRVMDKRKK